MSASLLAGVYASATPAYKVASLYAGPGSATVSKAASALTITLATVTVLATLF